jgi:hypothetical protein
VSAITLIGPVVADADPAAASRLTATADIASRARLVLPRVIEKPSLALAMGAAWTTLVPDSRKRHREFYLRSQIRSSRKLSQRPAVLHVTTGGGVGSRLLALAGMIWKVAASPNDPKADSARILAIVPSSKAGAHYFRSWLLEPWPDCDPCPIYAGTPQIRYIVFGRPGRSRRLGRFKLGIPDGSRTL